ncbi:MAG: 4'-phosphopantetheinyl transferase superfamily protein [Flavobacteriales bacterium]|nr:4'-phosphopantetheinyl transferase superfamily protein [Flavobacteriales bacterium]MCX7769159.1 4'-phosphopantetheinyl transferase superfamily protein [Flavobacteriales bacterium]MDW8410774.1 4'-phosphopantetheinyl transferase superfamily protein [Flavobacteriales bacterium]
MEKFPARASQKRQREYLLSRLLVAHILEEPFTILYNDAGKPYLVGKPERISLSHSGEAAVLWIGRHAGGVDIQKDDARILRVARHFLSPEQFRQAEKIQDHLRRKSLLLKAWTIKEACYKSLDYDVGYRCHILFGLAELQHSDQVNVIVVTGRGLICRNLWHFCNGQYHLAFTV